MDKVMTAVMEHDELKHYHTVHEDETEMEMLKEKRVCHLKYLLGGSKFYIG